MKKESVNFIGKSHYKGLYADMTNQRDKLVDAAMDVLTHREGSLPVRGWLRDTDASRAALERLAEAVAKHREQQS